MFPSHEGIKKPTSYCGWPKKTSSPVNRDINPLVVSSTSDILTNTGAFYLSVKGYDILNQTRRLTHTVTAYYEEDTYCLCMGRYILFGVKWNFGKMNAAHSARAQQAAWNMLF